MESRVGELIFFPLSKWITPEVGRSAFDLLRYPHTRSADFVTSIPALSTFDPRVLARVDIDGTPHYFILSSTNPDGISSQDAIRHTCAANRQISVCS
jgi:hypothetical protein